MPPVERNVQGVIKEVYEGDYGVVMEGDTTSSGKPPRDFYQPGAKVEFKTDDKVTYIEITFPAGAGPDRPPLVKGIKKRT